MSTALEPLTRLQPRGCTIRCLHSAGLLVGLGIASVHAAESVYTPLDLKTCSQTSKDMESVTWACRGVHGIRVYVTDSDARMSVSYGTNAEQEPAATTWFGPLNSTGPTIEWRTERSDTEPYATIVRWFLRDPERSARRSVLVVTRLGPGRICHIAYIDADANPNANELARRAADEYARGFRCNVEAVRTVGRVGRGVTLIRKTD
jgi:hypothetical protein